MLKKIKQYFGQKWRQYQLDKHDAYCAKALFNPNQYRGTITGKHIKALKQIKKNWDCDQILIFMKENNPTVSQSLYEMCKLLGLDFNDLMNDGHDLPSILKQPWLKFDAIDDRSQWYPRGPCIRDTGGNFSHADADIRLNCDKAEDYYATMDELKLARIKRIKTTKKEIAESQERKVIELRTLILIVIGFLIAVVLVYFAPTFVWKLVTAVGSLASICGLYFVLENKY